MKIIFKRIYWKMYIYWLALHWVNALNLGDEIVYRNNIYSLVQGVQSPRWDIKGDGEYLKSIHESDFVKRKTLSNYFGSYKSGVQFYMQSWYSIWVNEGITPWMRACDIWKKR